MKPAPIVLFTYNRPWHTQQTVEALQKNELADLSDLIIYSDGSKDEDDRKNVQAVRDYLKNIDGFKSAKIIEQERNRGLAASIISGVTEVVNKYGKIIVLEDDLVIAPCFLKFMNEALEYYINDKKVMQISGHMFDVNITAATDAVLLPFTTSWGWATWKRAWEAFNPSMSSGYAKLKNDKALQTNFNLQGAYNYFDMLKLQAKGKIDSWAIRWYLSVFTLDGLTLYPVQSLIKNIGFDGSGTHCKSSSSYHYSKRLHSFSVPNINFPDISLNRDAYSQIIQYLNSQRSFKAKLRAVFSGLKG